MHHPPLGPSSPCLWQNHRRSLLGLALKLWLLGLALALWSLWPTPAAAQPESVPQTAQFHLDRGYDFFRNKQYDRAVQEFRAAQALKPSSINFFNEARAWEEAGRPEDGLTALASFMALAAEEQARGKVDPTLTETMVRARALRTKLENLVYGGLLLPCEPPQARVTLDGPGGIQRGVCPWTNVQIKAGRYQVEIDGGSAYRPFRGETVVTAGETTRLPVALEAAPGRLRIQSSVKGAAILVDGRPVGTTPRLDLEVDGGNHRIEVQFQGGPWQREVKIPAGDTLLVEAEPRSSGNWVWWVVGGGVGVVAITAGILLPILLAEDDQGLELGDIAVTAAELRGGTGR